MSNKTGLKIEAFQRALAMQRVGNAAVHKAQTQNRAKGIANFYSVGGRIVSDVDGAEKSLPFGAKRFAKTIKK